MTLDKKRNEIVAKGLITHKNRRVVVVIKKRKQTNKGEVYGNIERCVSQPG